MLLVLVHVFIEWPLSNLCVALTYTVQSDWFIWWLKLFENDMDGPLKSTHQMTKLGVRVMSNVQSYDAFSINIIVIKRFYICACRAGEIGGGGMNGPIQLLPRFWQMQRQSLFYCLPTRFLYLPPCFEEILLLPKNRIEPLWCSRKINSFVSSWV